MSRLPPLILSLSTVLLAWLWMQIVHECGHALCGWLTGGEIQRVVLHPLTISRTDLGKNPYPLAVCWAGPVMGTIVPALCLLIAHLLKWSGEYWLRFFAGFCLIANGAYLAVGSWNGIGDAGDLTRSGSPLWMLWLFGAITIPLGLRCWYGLGPRFGMGRDADPVRWMPALNVAAALLITVIVESIFSSY